MPDRVGKLRGIDRFRDAAKAVIKLNRTALGLNSLHDQSNPKELDTENFGPEVPSRPRHEGDHEGILRLHSFNGNLEATNTLLAVDPASRGRWITSIDFSGWKRNMIHWTALSGSLHTLKALIEALKEDIEARRDGVEGWDDLSPILSMTDCLGRTPLHLAAGNGWTELSGYLVGLGADPGEVDHVGYNALHLAALRDHAGVYSEIREASAEKTAEAATARDSASRTPIHVACGSGSVGFIAVAGNGGERERDVVRGRVPDSEGRTPLHHAVGTGSTDVAVALLKAGADPSAHDHNGATPLHYAAFLSLTDVLKAMVKAGVDLNVRDGPSGATPLHWMVERGSVETARALLEGGAEVHAVDSKDKTALHWACEQGGTRADLVQLFLSHLPEDKQLSTVNARDFEGRTCIHYCASRGVEDVTRMLLGAGADPNIPDNKRVGPVHYGSLRGYLGFVQVLYQAGSVNLNKRDGTGRTPLIWAAGGGRPMVLSWLLEHQPPVRKNEQDNDAWTALDWATDGVPKDHSHPDYRRFALCVHILTEWRAMYGWQVDKQRADSLAALAARRKLEADQSGLQVAAAVRIQAAWRAHKVRRAPRSDGSLVVTPSIEHDGDGPVEETEITVKHEAAQQPVAEAETEAEGSELSEGGCDSDDLHTLSVDEESQDSEPLESSVSNSAVSPISSPAPISQVPDTAESPTQRTRPVDSASLLEWCSNVAYTKLWAKSTVTASGCGGPVPLSEFARTLKRDIGSDCCAKELQELLGVYVCHAGDDGLEAATCPLSLNAWCASGAFSKSREANQAAIAHVSTLGHVLYETGKSAAQLWSTMDHVQGEPGPLHGSMIPWTNAAQLMSMVSNHSLTADELRSCLRLVASSPVVTDGMTLTNLHDLMVGYADVLAPIAKWAMAHLSYGDDESREDIAESISRLTGVAIPASVVDKVLGNAPPSMMTHSPDHTRVSKGRCLNPVPLVMQESSGAPVDYATVESCLVGAVLAIEEPAKAWDALLERAGIGGLSTNHIPWRVLAQVLDPGGATLTPSGLQAVAAPFQSKWAPTGLTKRALEALLDAHPEASISSLGDLRRVMRRVEFKEDLGIMDRLGKDGKVEWGILARSLAQEGVFVNPCALKRWCLRYISLDSVARGIDHSQGVTRVGIRAIVGHLNEPLPSYALRKRGDGTKSKTRDHAHRCDATTRGETPRSVHIRHIKGRPIAVSDPEHGMKFMGERERRKMVAAESQALARARLLDRGPAARCNHSHPDAMPPRVTMRGGHRVYAQSVHGQGPCYRCWKYAVVHAFRLVSAQGLDVTTSPRSEEMGDGHNHSALPRIVARSLAPSLALR